MEVGVEEAVLEEHADDARGAEVHQDVALLVGEALGLGRSRLEALEELHAEHAAAAVLPVDLGEGHPRQVVEIGGEGLGVVGLPPQVHLAPRVLDELADEL
jgi:hypothetical protein